MFKPFGRKDDLLTSPKLPLNEYGIEELLKLCITTINQNSPRLTISPNDTTEPKVSFDGVWFQTDSRHTSLKNIQASRFENEFKFSHSLIQQVHFENVTLSYVELDYCVVELCDFKNCRFQGGKYTNTLFLKCTFSNCSFHYGDLAIENCRFENCIFEDCSFYRQVFLDCYFDRITKFLNIRHHILSPEENRYSYLLCEEIKEGYLASKSYEEAKTYFYRAEKAYTKANLEGKEKFRNEIFCLLNGYGVKPFRILYSVIASILIFSLLYWPVLGIEKSCGYLNETPSSYQYLLLSAGAFFTFGSSFKLGPLSGILFTIESLIGITLTGLFLVALSNSWTFGRKEF